jgi:hypothetical protein
MSFRSTIADEGRIAFVQWINSEDEIKRQSTHFDAIYKLKSGIAL